MPFQPGQSGNPTGRPKGARHKTTMAIESLLDGEAEALTRKVIEKAKEGDLAALKLCLDRLAPVQKGRPIAIDLPDVNCAADLAQAGAVVTQRLGEGIISPEEAAAVTISNMEVVMTNEYSKAYSTPIALRINEAARQAGVGRSTIYNAIKRGDLPLRKCGSRSLVLVDDLKKWITSLPEAGRD